MKIRNTLLVCAALLTGFAAQAQTLAGRIIHVSDGDTVTALLPGHEKIRIRLAGIDAPESRQDFGTRSRQLMTRLVKGRDVQIFVVDTDKYGRKVARIETEDGDAGYAMLEAGLARVFIRYISNLPRDYQASYIHAENLARAEKRGLWSDPGQIPPWQWRQKQRSPHGF